MTVSETLAEYISDLTFEGLPKEVVDKATNCILDSAGCMLGGSRTDVVKILAAFAGHLGGKLESTIIGTKEMTSCANAAFVNSESANVLDFDDTFMGHPGATVIPPALAVAEAQHATGKELILAVVAGYEVSMRIGIAIRPSYEISKKIAGYQTWQIFGAVASSSKLLNLKKKAIHMAMGIAGAAAPIPSDMKCSMNPLNKEVGMPMTKNNYGWASLIGVNATILAKMGYTGPVDIFEGETGFWRMYGSDRCDFEKFIDGFGRSYYILKVAFKPYSCCRYLHPALDATLKIVKNNKLEVEDIEKITVNTFSDITVPPWDDRKPKTMQSAIHSIPYCIAIAITGSKPGLEWFTKASLTNSKVLELAKKVELVGDPEADKMKVDKGKTLLANVQIHSKKGTFQEVVDCPKGEPENPMTDKELRAKFKRLAKKVITDEKAKTIFHMIKNLENIKDVAEITKLLRVCTV